jgi:uncharacterized surface protein with fasciclin (FAS1) repeats
MLQQVLCVFALAGLLFPRWVICQNDTLGTALSALPQLSNYTAFLSLYPDLVSEISGLQNVTVFAPTNDAFAEALSTTSLASQTGDEIETLFRYHTVTGISTFEADAILETKAVVDGHTEIIKYNHDGRSLIAGSATTATLGVSPCGHSKGLANTR